MTTRDSKHYWCFLLFSYFNYVHAVLIQLYRSLLRSSQSHNTKHFALPQNIINAHTYIGHVQWLISLEKSESFRNHAYKWWEFQRWLTKFNSENVMCSYSYWWPCKYKTRTTRTPAFWGYPRRLMITHTIESYWIPSQKKTKSKLQI